MFGRIQVQARRAYPGYVRCDCCHRLMPTRYMHHAQDAWECDECERRRKAHTARVRVRHGYGRCEVCGEIVPLTQLHRVSDETGEKFWECERCTEGWKLHQTWIAFCQADDAMFEGIENPWRWFCETHA